jgi:hypothetical protein
MRYFLTFSAIRAALSACTEISPGHGHPTGRSPAARRATSVRTGEYYFDYEPSIAGTGPKLRHRGNGIFDFPSASQSANTGRKLWRIRSALSMEDAISQPRRLLLKAGALMLATPLVGAAAQSQIGSPIMRPASGGATGLVPQASPKGLVFFPHADPVATTRNKGAACGRRYL